MMTRKVYVVLILFFISSKILNAGSYHVAKNNAEASDENPGTAEAPFLTIQKAATIALAGDTIWVHEGIYRETITPIHSGTAEKPIVYMSYGDDKVTISGVEVISGWELHMGNIYKAPMASDFFISSVNMTDQVFVDAKMMNLARWPNTSLDLSYPIKAITSSFVSKEKDKETNVTTGIMKDDDLPEGDFLGAEIYMQPNNGAWSWTFTGTVTDVSGTQFTFESLSSSGKDFEQEVYHPNSRYYFYNELSLLDTAGEWYHDKESEWLYLWLPDNEDPADHLIEAKARDYGFNLSEKSYIEIIGFHLFGCNITTDDAAGGDGKGYSEDGTVKYPWRGAGSIAESHHVTIDGIHCLYPSHSTDVSGHFFFQYGGHSGIVLSGEYHVLKNSIIRYCFANGVSMLGNYHLILNNVIEDVNYSACGYGAMGSSASKAYDSEIAYNTIRRTGRSGIRLGIRNSDPNNIIARVHHNEISDFMIQDRDGGGIYMGGDGGFLRIDHNIIHGGKGYIVSGIYPDWGKNYIYDHNVLYNVWATFQITHSFKNEGINNLIIYNNTTVCTNNDKFSNGPFNFVCSGEKEGVILKNNIGWVYKPPQASNYKVWNDDATFDDIVKSHNLFDVDPQLDNYPINFHLQSSSPAIDAGEPMDTVILDGVKIPPFNDPVNGPMDIGAYEYGLQPFYTGSSLDTASGSFIEIFAAGETGLEAITLMINDNPVAIFDSIGGNMQNDDFQVLTHQAHGKIYPGMVKTWFANYKDTNGQIRIDKIKIDGVEYQTEDMVCSCTSENTEFLTCSGYFHYREKPLYTVTIIAENGTVTMDPPGGAYNEGTQVTLTAIPDEGYEFVSWTGDASGVTSPKVINVKNDRTITVNFQVSTAVSHKELSSGHVIIYPNPFNGNELNIKLHESWGDNVVVTIVDMQGRLIDQMETSVTNAHVLWVSHSLNTLKKGVYYLKIDDENRTHNSILMVK